MRKLFPVAACLLSLAVIPYLYYQEPNLSSLSTMSDKQSSAELVRELSNTKKEKTPIYAIVYPVAHPFFEGVTITAKETAKELGVNVMILAPDVTNVHQQIQIMENLIQKNVDGIAIGPTDPAVLTPFINKAMDAGINVVCFDTDAPDSDRLSYIGTDNLAAGKHVGQVVAELLNNEGTVIISTGISSMLNLNTRVEGVKQILEQYPMMEILDIRSSDGIPAKALSNIEEMVEEYPNFDAFIGIDSLSGPAAVTIWKAKGINKPAVTFDDLPLVLDGIANKQITSTISQSQFTWGKLIIEQLHEAYLGKDIPEHYISKTTEVNIDNLANYKNNAQP